MTVRCHTVTDDEVNKRIDVLLASITNNSRQSIQTWIKERIVKVNNQIVKPSYKCALNDEIEWHEPKKESLDIKSENIPLQIIYEDEDIIILNKMKGMLTHPAQMIVKGTLVNALLNYTTALSNLSGDERPGIVHRLDKDTSGIMVIAKNNEAHLHLVNQFKVRTVTRKYEAIVRGVVTHDHGIIKAPIGRDPNHRQNMTVIATGKEAETHFSVIKRYKDYTHVSCELITGRTHQIRVHMKHIGHPLIGDLKYNRKKTKQDTGLLLFAKELSFLHPKTDERMSFTVECPTHFEKFLQTLEKMA